VSGSSSASNWITGPLLGVSSSSVTGFGRVAGFAAGMAAAGFAGAPLGGAPFGGVPVFLPGAAFLRGPPPCSS